MEKDMAPRAGLEPATDRLTADCSTTELPRNTNGLLIKKRKKNIRLSYKNRKIKK